MCRHSRLARKAQERSNVKSSHGHQHSIMLYCILRSCVFLPIPFPICVLVLPHRWWFCLLLWMQIRGGIMVGAADCRSAGPWFNSGWKSWFTFLTGYDKLTNQIIQMFNNMSPIRTVITTITRKPVNIFSFFTFLFLHFLHFYIFTSHIF